MELMHFVYTLRFYINHHMKIDSKHALEILRYAIGSKADEVWFSKFMKAIQLQGMKACQMFIDELIEQAFKKGFNTVKTYVQFLKLTCIKRNGLMQILSEDEQRHAKRWVLMKRNFDNFVTFFNVDIATPESTHVWEISET